MKQQLPNRILRLLALVIFAATLAACGGGGGDAPAPNNGGNSQNPDPQPQPDPDPQPQPDPDPQPDPEPATFSVSLNWNIPDSRENGDTLEVYEIGGYEIRYKLTSDDEYTSIVINDSSSSSYQITDLQAGTYEFTMASFDIENLYSEFTDPEVTAVGT